MTSFECDTRRIVRLIGMRLGLWHAVLVVSLVLMAGGTLASPACAVTVDEPTVLGPSGSVHHSNTGGYDGGYDWVETQGIDNPEVNAAQWETPLSEGAYQVEAWIPKEAGTTYARYEITHAGLSSEVRLRQSNFANEWVILGDYAFNAGQASVRSTDAAGYPGEQLAWSAIRCMPLESIPPNIEVSGATTTINEPLISGPEEFVVRFAGVGYRGDLLRAYAQGAGATAVNTATWTVPVAAGEYSVEAYIPKEHAEAEVGYTVHARTGDITVPVEQKSYNNIWEPLGDFKFGPSGASVSSSDATGIKEEEIAWDALRFTILHLEKTIEEKPTEKPTEKTVEKPIEKMVEPPGAGPTLGGGGSPDGSVQTAVTTVEPLVKPPKKLLEFAKIVTEYGPHRSIVGPRDLYSVSALPRSKTLTLSYKCAPCLMIRSPLKLRPHTHTPLTRTSFAEGSVSSFLNREFYKGSVLEVEVGEANHRARLYTYYFPGAGRIGGPKICTAAPGPVGACLR